MSNTSNTTRSTESDTDVGEGSTPGKSHQKVTTTQTESGTRLHLHQIILLNGDREWVVVGLGEKLVVATTDFNYRREYNPKEIAEDIEPKVTAVGTPIFGY